MRILLSYINALPEDHELLTETAMASKRNWGYTEDLMLLWQDELSVSKEYILQNTVVKVFNDNIFIGFFALRETGRQGMEIDHLWLLPDAMRKGFGRLIFSHILYYLKIKGYKKAFLIADPNAKGFYDKMKGRVTGSFESKLSGRYLELYEFNVD